VIRDVTQRFRKDEELRARLRELEARVRQGRGPSGQYQSKPTKRLAADELLGLFVLLP
jgi:hypothetical protein